MTAAIIVRCDGTPTDRETISTGRCRASFPTNTAVAHEAVSDAVAHDWSTEGSRDLCPSCTRAKRKKAGLL